MSTDKSIYPPLRGKTVMDKTRPPFTTCIWLDFSPLKDKPVTMVTGAGVVTPPTQKCCHIA